MTFDTDLFIIGAGSGGVRAARIAADHGARVIIAEEFRIGGTCVIRGCVPKKLMVYASRFADDFEDAAGYGWQVGETRFDWPSLVAAKEKEITRLSAAYRANLDRARVTIIEERARLEGAQAVRLASVLHSGARIRPTQVNGVPRSMSRLTVLLVSITCVGEIICFASSTTPGSIQGWAACDISTSPW